MKHAQTLLLMEQKQNGVKQDIMYDAIAKSFVQMVSIELIEIE